MGQSNPYTGTDFESAWSSGYAAGLAEPTTTHAPPGDLTADQAVVFGEGELAGQEDSSGGVNEPVPVNPETHPETEHSENPVAIGGHVVELGMMGREAYELQGVIRGTVAVAEGITAVGLSVALAIEVFVLLITLEEPPPGQEPPTLTSFLAQQCVDSNCSELYMPVCVAKDPSLSSAPEDQMLSAGYWHGRLYPDNAQGATQEAGEYLSAHLNLAGSVGVLRFQAAVPNTVEFAVAQAKTDDDQWHPPML